MTREREILESFGDGAYYGGDPAISAFVIDPDAEDDAREIDRVLDDARRLIFKAYVIAADYGPTACSRLDDFISDISGECHRDATGSAPTPAALAPTDLGEMLKGLPAAKI